MKNTRTNLFLGTIVQALEELSNQGTNKSIPVTVIVSGKMISGEVVSSSEYFSHALTAQWKAAYDLAIKEPRDQYFDAPEDKFNPDNIPDDLKQTFIFLKNAFYIDGNQSIPSSQNEGIPIQVRLADVSAFSFGSVKFD